MKLLGAVIAALMVFPLGVAITAAAMIGVDTDEQVTARTTSGGFCVNWEGETPSDVSLTDAQMSRAATIYEVAQQTGIGSAGAIVGIATAMQESQLGAHPGAMSAPNSDGDIGLFQQRTLVGWYADGETQEENITTLLDDEYQARNFFLGHDTLSGWHIPGLVDIDGWETMSVTEAAQAVQVSAFPDAYAKHEAMARSVVASFDGNPSDMVLCGPVSENLSCPPTGMDSEKGQTPDALRVMRCTLEKFPQITTLLGVRPGDPRDHGTGRAVDIMIPDFLNPTQIAWGDEMAEWLKAHASELGITYIIWREKIWAVKRDSEGWRSCAPRACYTGPDHSAAHRDHIHVSVHGNQGTGFSSPTSSGKAVLPLPEGSYRLTAFFGQSGRHWAKNHTGLDFAAPQGTPLYAVQDATVTTQTWHSAYGNLIKLRTSDGTEFWYAHLHTTAVRQGDTVKAGQQIGTVGTTGNSTGNHLHFEVRTGGKPVDPLAWLKQQGLNP